MTKDKFHKYFEEIWQYRLKHINEFSSDLHQLIIHLSICDYHLQYDNYQKGNVINDYNFIIQKFQKHNKFIDYRIKKCITIIESYVLMEKLKNGLGN